MSNDLTPMDSWPVMLPLYIAELEASEGIPLHTIEEICSHCDITEYELEIYKGNPTFRAEVRSAILELKDSNSIIRKKLRMQVGVYTDTWIPKIMADPEVDNRIKADLYKFMAKAARIVDDPIEKAKAEADLAAKTPQTAQFPNLTLIFPSAPSPVEISKGVVIEHAPTKDTSNE